MGDDLKDVQSNVSAGRRNVAVCVMEVGVAIVAGAGLATVFEAPRPNTRPWFALDDGQPT